ncbi:hypothetical protein MFLAVUS_006233 [Mucor flavus]|uniref:Ribosomal protein S11 n=1 Tax=Mucor flavus TaxID=439312 RepID=A0ABP9Z0Y5_9FUNG
MVLNALNARKALKTSSQSEGISKTNLKKTLHYSITDQTIAQVNAGDGVKKLILEASGFNLLVTASVTLFPSSLIGAHGWLSFVSFSGVNSAKIVLVKERVEKFKAVDTCKIINLRQLTSYYNRHPTYRPLKTSLFTDVLKVPAITFTLCSSPSKYGYGRSESSSRHIVSHLLKIFGLTAIKNNNIVSKEKFEKFFIYVRF